MLIGKEEKDMISRINIAHVSKRFKNTTTYSN